MSRIYLGTVWKRGSQNHQIPHWVTYHSFPTLMGLRGPRAMNEELRAEHGEEVEAGELLYKASLGHSVNPGNSGSTSSGSSTKSWLFAFSSHAMTCSRAWCPLGDSRTLTTGSRKMLTPIWPLALSDRTTQWAFLHLREKWQGRRCSRKGWISWEKGKLMWSGTTPPLGDSVSSSQGPQTPFPILLPV